MTSAVRAITPVPSHETLSAEPARPGARLEALAQLTLLRRQRLHGQGVAVAIVDDGIYAESLRAKLGSALALANGACPVFDTEHSHVAGSVAPFSRTRRSHGSMCAYDACLGAPGCTLLDFPVLAPRSIGRRRINDVLAAYRRIVDLLLGGVFRHVVVVNAWQTLPGDEWLGVKTDAPAHPLYRALSDLDAAGADVLFAAPDHHAKQIHGPALHPLVLTVGAVGLDGAPFDSSVERATTDGSDKPDVCNYQGFPGYELCRNQGDYGTSAATALTAGQLAAVRSSPRGRGRRPAELRALFRASTARTQPADAAVPGPGIVDVAHVLNHLSSNHPC